MNPAQKRLYWWEWGQVRDHLAAKGVSAGQIEKERHALHVRALGKDKSSTRLTNTELDKVIGVFRATWDGGNLEAQMRQLDQADRRSDMLRARIVQLAEECGVADGVDGIEAYFRNWLKGRSYASLNERELQQLQGILVRRKTQLPKAAPSVSSEDDGEPF